MKILISVDMEGVGGVTNPADVRPGTPEYDHCSSLLVGEVNAAIEGILTEDPDATVVVADAHAQFLNIRPGLLHPGARLIRGAPRSYGMMTGLDCNTDAVMLLGYHAKAGTLDAVLAHTISGSAISDVRCDGQSIGEIGLNIALAAHAGAMPVLVTGDDKATREAQDAAPGICAITVKTALGYQAAECLPPAEIHALIRDSVPRALRNRGEVQPLRFNTAVDLEVDVRHPVIADHAVLIPRLQRRGASSLRYPGCDIETAYAIVRLIALLGSSI